MYNGKVLNRSKNSCPKLYIRAENIYLYDDNGNQIIDGCSNSMNVNLGYSQHKIVESMTKQAKLLPFVHNKKCTTEIQEVLAKELSALVANQYMCYFCSNGSDAIETAMRIAYQYQVSKNNLSKNKFLSWSGSYHGSSLGALSVTGNDLIISKYKNYVLDYPKLKFPDCKNCKVSKCELDCLKKLKQNSSENIAGMVVDGMLANCFGSKMPPTNYMEELQKICREKDILIIVDEIATSIGRTGKNFCYEYFNGFSPDIICLSKGIGVGYTNLGAVLVSNKVIDSISDDKDFLGHTYNGNPISCAGGLAALQIINKDGILQNVNDREKELVNYLNTWKMNEGIKDINGKGLMYSIEFNKKILGNDFIERINETSLENGLLLLSANLKNSMHITIAPPLIIDRQQLTQLCDRLDCVLKKVLQDKNK